MNHSHPALATIVGILTAVVAVCVFLVAANYWSFWPYDNPSGIACTMEAKLCPDGSSVGRTGPKCEFAPCPTGAIYTNNGFGLAISLPSSWKGYRVISDEGETAGWHATDVSAGDNNEVASGPMVILRHPLWTEAKPYENLPIMVFTLDQWKHVGMQGTNDWSVSAAPIPPSELARNGTYVFALPARYNYDFAEGYQILDDAIRAGAVSAFQPER